MKGRGRKQQDGAEGKAELGCGASEGLSLLHGSSGAGWPFRVVLTEGEKSCWPLYLHVVQLLDVSCPSGEA